MTDIFISYSKNDKDLVFSICNYLEKNGITCWIAPRNIPPGSEYAAEIIKGIENCKLFLLMYSDTSNASQHVLREVGRAVHRNAPIIAYRITKATPTKSMEYFLETIQWLDAPYKDCTTPTVLLKSIQNVLANEPLPVLPSNMPTHCSLNVLMHKYSTYIVGLLSVVIICLIITLFKFNSGHLSPDNNASDMLTEVTPTDDPNATLEAATSDEPSESPISTTTPETSMIPEASPDSDPIAVNEPTINSPSNNNSVSEPDMPVAIIDNDAIDVPAPAPNISDNSPVTPNAPTNTPAPTSKISLKVGEYIEFGTYHPQGYNAANNDGRIKWLILSVDENAGTALCLTDKIIDLKCFDGAESGNYFHDKNGEFLSEKTTYTTTQHVDAFGSNDWSTSNIRTWLNSAQAQVTYNDQAPTKNSISEYKNAYANQAGFLHGFSASEQSLISPRTNSTSGNSIDPSAKTTTDKVFLLSQAEVQKYLIDQNFVTYTTPTQSAIDSDKSFYYSDSKKQGFATYPWFLRSPDNESPTKVIIVTAGTYIERDFYKQIACICSMGIRPAVVIHYGNSTISGEGTESNPYTIK